MLSIKPERPVDALTIAVSREIDRVARDLGLPYFLTGAMAHDILLTHVFGIAIGRATRDVDFGVAVGNWEQFDLIKGRLIETGRFNRAEKSSQRIYYKSQASNVGYPVDIIPFGGVPAEAADLSGWNDWPMRFRNETVKSWRIRGAFMRFCITEAAL